MVGVGTYKDNEVFTELIMVCKNEKCCLYSPYAIYKCYPCTEKENKQYPVPVKYERYNN
jgi:hypothetical protein